MTSVYIYFLLYIKSLFESDKLLLIYEINVKSLLHLVETNGNIKRLLLKKTNNIGQLIYFEGRPLKQCYKGGAYLVYHMLDSKKLNFSLVS